MYIFSVSYHNTTLAKKTAKLWEHSNIANKFSQGNKYVQSDDQSGFKRTSRVAKLNWNKAKHFPNCLLFDPNAHLSLGIFTDLSGAFAFSFTS